MENASKALSMAASILIGLLLLALLIYAYYQFVQIPKQEETIAKTEQTAEFNQKYMAYAKNTLKGNKLVSLLNMAIDNNETYEDVDGYQIKIEITGSKNFMQQYKENRNNASSELNRENIKNNTYEFVRAEYGGTDGRISYMEFKQKQ